jgi:ATP-dependent DNA helicase RecQ
MREMRQCDTCLKPVETWDGTDTAIKALAAIYRTGERFGTGHLIDVLLGNINEKTERFGHATMPVFGAGKDIPSRTWQSVFRQLLAMGLIRVDHGAFGALKLEAEARASSSASARSFSARIVRRPSVGAKKTAQAERRSVLSGSDGVLFEALRTERTSIAKSLGVPPYVVFPDTTLIAFATERPRTQKELLGIPGVGQSKLERYGDAFLDVILTHDD